jgi:nicotinamidase-related amidase
MTISLGRGILHVVVDMQRIFAETTAWHVPTLEQVLPPILALTKERRAATVFTRFITPPDSGSVPDGWQSYYRHWRPMLGDRLGSGMLDLVEPLQSLASAADVYDRATYSAFGSPAFAEAVSWRQARTLVLTGVETDVCILATALAAVDRGLHVVVAADAVTSWSPAGHRAALEAILPRYDQQIDVASAEDILAAWPMD